MKFGNPLDKARICFLHIGTHKTGTTSIQAFLRDNHRLFADQGAYIPFAGRGKDAAGHHNLTQQLLGGAGFVKERGGLEEIVEELRRTDKRRACLSSEDFSLVSRSTDSLVTLRDAITSAGFSPVIVVYLRPQVSYCVSIYAEIIKNGSAKPFPTYLAELHEHGTFLWDGSLGPPGRYDELLERFAAVFGERAIIVRRYRSDAPSRAMLESFARILIGRQAQLTLFDFPHERFNPSPSFARVLRTLLEREFDLPDMRFAPLDLREALQLAALFFGRNTLVRRRFGVWIPPVEWSDFLLAQPVRKTIARTTSLARARRELREFGSGFDY